MRVKVRVLVGKITGFINTPWEIESNGIYEVDEKDLIKLEGDYIAEGVMEDSTRIVYPSLSGAYDLFFLNNNHKGLLYSNDFFWIVKQQGKVTYDYQQLDFFLKKGYLMPGKTFFNEVKRVELGKALKINGDNVDIVKLCIDEWNIGYKQFLSTIKYSILNRMKSGNKNILLFSGGKDSGFLSVFLKKEFGIDPILYTGNYVEPSGFRMNEKDIERGKIYKEKLGLDLRYSDVNINDFSVDKILYLVERMPMASHLSVLFQFLFNKISELDGDISVWTGQNADTVYGLGNTGSNIPNILTRYMLTNHYINSFSDTKNKVAGRILGQLIGKSYQIKRGIKLYPPRYSYDFIDKAMNGIIMMSDSPLPDKRSITRNVNSDDVRKVVWENYQSAHLTGMDHQIIRNAGDERIERNFPFSSVRSMLMFRSIRFGLKDIMHPKYYISRYLKEFWGRKLYDKLYPVDLSFLKINKDISNFEDNIFDTNYGKSMLDYLGMKKSDSMNLQNVISKVWLKRMEEIIKSEGIEIR